MACCNTNAQHYGLIFFVLMMTACGQLNIIDTTSTAGETGEFTLGSFNVQNYGTSKSGEDAVMNMFVKIFSRYDIFVMQELEDPINQTSTNSGPVIRDFLDRMNKANNDDYKMTVSARVGAPGPEQYACFYRKSKFSLVSAAVYADPNSKFTRPPYIIRMHHTFSSEEFYLVTIHTKPAAATEEIYAFEEVVDTIKGVDPDIIILGDFNGDGAYFNTTTGWPAFNLIKQGYKNLIGDSVNTTVAQGNTNSYDRILASPSIIDNVVADSNLAFYFDDTGLGGFDLSEIKTEGCTSPVYISSCPASTNIAAKEVSDHYPVEVKLKMVK